jgi:hypothetical protein
MPGIAAVALEAFLKAHKISLRVASEALNVTHPTVIAWLQGTAKPDSTHRKLIAVWTSDAVPEMAWMTAEEQIALGTLVPFRPGPQVAESESGPLPAADPSKGAA